MTPTPDPPRDFLKQPASRGLVALIAAFVVVLAAAFVWWGNHQSDIQDKRLANETVARAQALERLTEERAKEVREAQIARRDESRIAVKLLCEENNTTVRVIRRLVTASIPDDEERRKSLIGLTNPPRDCQEFIDTRLPRVE